MDNATFIAELDTHRRYLLRVAHLQLRDADLAEDIVQETLVAALSAQAGFTGGWLESQREPHCPRAVEGRWRERGTPFSKLSESAADGERSKKHSTATMLAAALATFLLAFAHTYGQMLIAALGVGLAGGSFAVGVAYVSRFFQPIP